MTKIPSIEQTNDFIYRIEVAKGTPLSDANCPNLLVFEGYSESVGPLHSLDVAVLRDGVRATDIEFRSCEHMPSMNFSCFKLSFFDPTHHVVEHNYLLTLILRYFATAGKRTSVST